MQYRAVQLLSRYGNVGSPEDHLGREATFDYPAVRLEDLESLSTLRAKFCVSLTCGPPPDEATGSSRWIHENRHRLTMSMKIHYFIKEDSAVLEFH